MLSFSWDPSPLVFCDTKNTSKYKQFQKAHTEQLRTRRGLRATEERSLPSRSPVHTATRSPAPCYRDRQGRWIISRLGWKESSVTPECCQTEKHSQEKRIWVKAQNTFKASRKRGRSKGFKWKGLNMRWNWVFFWTWWKAPRPTDHTHSHSPSLRLRGLVQNKKVEDRVLRNIFLQDKEGVQGKGIKNWQNSSDRLVAEAKEKREFQKVVSIRGYLLPVENRCI